jgi:hypothetical protein
MHTLHEFVFHNEAFSYLLAGVVLVAFIGWWRFLTDRESD